MTDPLPGAAPPPPATAPALAGPAGGGDTALVSVPCRALVGRAPVQTTPDEPIRAAAQRMRTHGVSSLLVVAGGRLLGLVTDRDLRNRVVAEGLDGSVPVGQVATAAPLTIQAGRPVFDALLMMVRHNIHHLPVLEGERILGMITATDITRQHGESPVGLASVIHRQPDVAGLAAVAARVPGLQRRLVAASSSAHATGQIITVVTDAITARLLQLAEEALGPPPVPYAWVAAGSQARREQTARSDQDNCLVLDDAYDPAAHGAYFEALANRVNDGLDACGYIYCPGEMMARTDAWRQPRRQWLDYFRRWTETPEPKALMLTCVFFDQRAVHGDAELLDGLRRQVLQLTRDNRLFLGHMVVNALQHRPPLSLFGGLSTRRSGEHRGTVDLKHTGTVPIIDLARIYALAGGHAEVNTHERLVVAADSREISEQSARDLRDALEFMATLRIQHQARQIEQGLPADNHLRPDALGNFERGQLKDAFGVVQTLQSVLAQRYR